MNLQEEQVFIENFKHGRLDEERFFHQYKRLIRFFVNKNVDPREQEDCYQECCVHLFDVVKKYDPERNVKFSSFLLIELRGICKNFNYWTRKEDKYFKSLDDMMDRLNFDAPDLTYKIDDFRTRFEVAIASLSEMERRIIVLHFFEEKTGREIAKILNIPFGSFSSREKRALLKLRMIILDEKD